MDKQISVDLLNKILAYLGQRPFIEVAGMIQEISLLKNVKNEKDSPEGS